MKDILSSQAGTTGVSLTPGETGPIGEPGVTIKGIALRNLGEYGRRVAIVTTDDSLVLGKDIHAADYAHLPEDLTGDELPEGFQVGKTVELNPKRNYHLVFHGEDFAYPAGSLNRLAAVGYEDLKKYSEMSDFIHNPEVTESQIHHGSVITTAELRQHSGLLNNYYFSMSLFHAGKYHHIALDAFKHPARMTADLNYQLDQKIPGVKGIVTVTPISGRDGRYFVDIYLSVNKKVQGLELHPADIEHFVPEIAGDDLGWQSYHVNNWLGDALQISVEEASVFMDAPRQTGFDEAPVTLQEHFEAAVDIADFHRHVVEGNADVLDVEIPPEAFKPYFADPRYNVALVRINPLVLTSQTWKLANVEYHLGDNATQPADLLAVANTFNEGETITGVNSVLFTEVGSAERQVFHHSHIAPVRLDKDIEFAERAGLTHDIIQTYTTNEDVSQTVFYIAVIAMPDLEHDLPMFRTPRSTTVRLHMIKTQYLGHHIDKGLNLNFHYDDVYSKTGEDLPLEMLEGQFEDDQILAGEVSLGEVTYNITDIVRDGNNVMYNIPGLNAAALFYAGYQAQYDLPFKLKSLRLRESVAMGYETTNTLRVNMTYPETDLGLQVTDSISWVKGSPTNVMDMPFYVNGNILGGFANAPLKHATSVAWEFKIDAGATLVLKDSSGLPIQGELGTDVLLGLDKVDLEALADGDHTLSIQLTATYPWLAEPVVVNTDVTFTVSTYVAGGGDTITAYFSLEPGGAPITHVKEGVKVYLNINPGGSVADGTTYTLEYPTGIGYTNEDDFLEVPPPPPANDNVADAIALTGNSGSLTATNLNATHEDLTDGGEGESSSSIWYKWTPSISGSATIDLSGSDFDTIMGLYNSAIEPATADSLLWIAGDDDSGEGSTSSITSDVIAGATYYIAVAGYGGREGNIVLTWSIS